MQQNWTKLAAHSSDALHIAQTPAAGLVAALVAVAELHTARDAEEDIVEGRPEVRHASSMDPGQEHRMDIGQEHRMETSNTLLPQPLHYYRTLLRLLVPAGHSQLRAVGWPGGQMHRFQRRVLAD